MQVTEPTVGVEGDTSDGQYASTTTATGGDMINSDHIRPPDKCILLFSLSKEMNISTKDIVDCT